MDLTEEIHLDQLIEEVLTGPLLNGKMPLSGEELAQAVRQFDTRRRRVVVLGGGTGLSTVVGGNSQTAAWALNPFVGLKQEFPLLDVVVCTTDDGGSTGLLLKSLPMIGIGDLRKSCLSMMLFDHLQQRYRTGEQQTRDLVRAIQQMFNHRFPTSDAGARILRNPLLAVEPRLRGAVPRSLARFFVSLGRWAEKLGRASGVEASGHCLGNLLLTAAIFREGAIEQPPGLREIRAGLDEVCEAIGAKPGRLHAATATPGQLKFRYMNAVEVYGQTKASSARRGFAVERLMAEYNGAPVVSGAVCRALREADLIVYAPGSLYSSLLPILQIEPIVTAIRSNQHALKVLGANFWVQEGETDLSPRHEGQGFLVSELIEAYDRNVPGGHVGLFDVVLSANLEHMPGNILRNYALEGKKPIHLDRARVEAMGLQPVEVTLFSPEHLRLNRAIQHDAQRFALAIRTLLFLQQYRGKPPRKKNKPARRGGEPARIFKRGRWLCETQRTMEEKLARRDIRPACIRETLAALAWENRDILPEHFDYFTGVRVLADKQWHRSNEWDNVLGYFDPEDGRIKLHESLLGTPARLKEDLLIALGESLLGRYIESRRWADSDGARRRTARSYEIRLRPPSERACWLNPAQLHTFLRLARLVRSAQDPLVYRITLNNSEGFLPPGLLFGLLYAWYLNNACGGVMEYEMSLLRWKPSSLIPYQAKERIRKQALVRFFCHEVFRHPVRQGSERR